ncbi:hypothetical protein Y1Q_0018089 [Alligator mississippiensis]|uniref:Uncharacterized protein n=1 Tax=Alligator mississippiensis TaxID=8496 RepID=A0A151NPV3_ALLMI|nr:hypothetical protein Y1Q_0018089 [Alligator mississippiensis]
MSIWIESQPEINGICGQFTLSRKGRNTGPKPHVRMRKPLFLVSQTAYDVARKEETSSGGVKEGHISN